MKNLTALLMSLTLILFSHFHLVAQISKAGKPYTTHPYFQQVLAEKNPLKTHVLPLIKEDSIQKKRQKGDNFFALGIMVDFNLNNSGEWIEVENGDRLWRLKLKSTDSKGMYLVYNKFWLPPQAQLFLYNEDQTQILGAFTSQNNTPSGKFTTAIIQGEYTILEYLEPASQKGKGVIEISHIGHIFNQQYQQDISQDTKYKKMNVSAGFNDAESCNINVNCEEGNNWQEEKRSVVRIIYIYKDGSGAYCSGALVNNTKLDGKGYVLSAFHCQDGGGEDNPPAYENCLFYFNYESPNCSNPTQAPANQTLVGCTEKAKRSASDVLLLELNDEIPDAYQPYYAGWSHSITAPYSGAGIHHPSGDIKKISVYNTKATSEGDYDVDGQYFEANSLWLVYWNKGIIEGGSSGSPLFNQNKHIVGVLSLGPDANAVCSLSSNQKYALYAKTASSWNVLKPFLSPNTDVETLNGYDPQYQLEHNVGISSITTEVSVCAFTESTPIKIRVKNYGLSTQNNFKVTYKLTDSQQNEQSGELTVQQDILSQETIWLTVTADLSAKETYTFQASTHLLEDENTENDQLTTIFIHQKPTVPPSNLDLNNSGNNELTISWENGDGENRLVLMKTNNDFTSSDFPQNGQSYDASFLYGFGDKIGSAYVVYNGNIDKYVRVLGINSRINYYVAVFEFSCNPTEYLTNSFAKTSTLITPIETYAVDYSIKVGPNPTESHLYVMTENPSITSVNVDFYSHLGNFIFQKQLNILRQSAEIDIQDLPKGLYVVKITTNTHQQTVHKIFVE
jgi:hypothetical protein